MFQLNRPRSLNPPMKNVVGSTYAETKTEIAAKRRVELENEANRLAAARIAAEPPRKSSVWFGVLMILFLVVALAGVGFGVYEYFAAEDLREENASLRETNSVLDAELTNLYRTQAENKNF